MSDSKGPFFYRHTELWRSAGIHPDGVHTIPVPRGWSPEQAWEAISRGDLLTDPEPFWANVLVRGGRFVELA